MLASVDKKGAGDSRCPACSSPCRRFLKAKRFGKDPFTGEERWFPPPASVKVKVRPLKLKDAAQYFAQYPVKLKGPPRKRGLSFARRFCMKPAGLLEFIFI